MHLTASLIFSGEICHSMGQKKRAMSENPAVECQQMAAGVVIGTL